MSGSGGYNKYRCKNFSTHGCDKWVLVKNSACAWCVADGRESLDMPAHQSVNRPLEVCMPIVHEGTITYSIMNLEQNGQGGSYWALRRSAIQQPSVPPITTSDTPEVVLPAAGMGTHQVYRQ